MSSNGGRIQVDPGLAVAGLIAMLAAWPLLTRASLPTLTDVHHHVYRTYEILAAWREGIAYLRWAPDFFYGYGYPVFNYYAPLTYYLAAAYGLFFGPVAGIKFVLVLSALVGAAGMYLLAREQWGAAAGVAAAAAYSLSPYLLFVDPVLRGAVPEALALALMPLLLWLGQRLVLTPTRAYLAATTALLTATLLTHNLFSIITVGLLVAWAAWQLPALSGQQRGRAARALGAAIGLAAGLAAFFWLPALLERDAIQLQGAFLPGVARGLIPPAELFAPATTLDTRALQIGDFKFRLGWPQWVFGALGALLGLQRRTRRGPVGFFSLVAIVSIGLILPASAPVWGALPPLAYLQFAWRLLGLAALGLAALTGAATQWGLGLHGRLGQPAVSGGVLAACLLAALPLLNPLPWPEFGPVDGAAIIDLELSGRWGVGTTHGIEFMPRAIQWVPMPQPAMVAAYRAGTVDKVDRTHLPRGVAVTASSHGVLHDAFHTAAPTAFELRVLTHDFPGWSAYLDGQRVPVRTTVPEGWLAVDVPAGDHDVLVRLEDTGPRILGWGLSGASALVLAAALTWTRRWPKAVQPAARARLGPRTAAVFAALVSAALLLHEALQLGSLTRVPIVPAGQFPRVAYFESNLVLLGYDLPQSQVSAGSEFRLALYWQATAPAPQPVSVFVHVYAADGSLWGQSDKLDPVELFPATRWPPRESMRAEHTVALQPEIRPGTYTLAVGLWYRPTGARSRLIDAAGQPSASDYLILTDELVVTARQQ